MRKVRCYRLVQLGAAFGLAMGFAIVALGQTLPRLPQDFTLPQGAGSPGKVVFSHQTHVDQKRPDCTVCHPALFKILEKGTPAQGARIRHEDMERGKQCGACHNEKAAFNLTNCMACHRGG